MEAETAPEWWKPGRFFSAVYLRGDKKQVQERTQRETDGIIRLLGIGRGALILDVPCGYGRHSIALAEMGCIVTGLDINKEYLGLAGKAAKQRGLKLRFLDRDMRQTGSDLSGRFDAVINMFFSFGFFEKETDNLRTMQGFCKALKMGGQLLLHTDVSPEMILRGKYSLKERRKLEDRGLLEINERYDTENNRLEGSWTICDPKGKTSGPNPYNVRIYTQKEFREMANDCGFRDIRFYGSFKGEPFTPHSKELIMVARK